MTTHYCKRLIDIPSGVPLKMYTVNTALKGTDPAAMVEQIADAVMAQHYAGKPAPAEMWVWGGTVWCNDAQG